MCHSEVSRGESLASVFLQPHYIILSHNVDMYNPKLPPQLFFLVDFSLHEHPPMWKGEKVLLWHAVCLLSLHQAGLVCVQDSERRVVLECREDSGAKIVLLVQEPNNC